MSDEDDRGAPLRDLTAKEALLWIEANAANESGARSPAALPVADIETVEPLFQPRPFDEAHAMEIAAAINAGRNVGPLLVYAVGERVLLIDGHHRLDAYRAAGIVAPVPVEFFKGKPKEAVLEARARNSPTKKAMSKLDRLNAAWTLVKLDKHSKTEIVDATLASKGSVDAMRKALRVLGPEEASECKTWWQARSACERKTGGTDMTETERRTWMEEQADTWADRLSKTFTNKMVNNPEIAAMALERHFGRRMGDVVYLLREHLPEKHEFGGPTEDDF